MERIRKEFCKWTLALALPLFVACVDSGPLAPDLENQRAGEAETEQIQHEK